MTLILLLAGCGLFNLFGNKDDGPADADADTDVDADTDADVPSCEGVGFEATAADWALPGGFAQGTFESTVDVDYGDGLNWYLVDLGGDDLPDLVFTHNDSVPATGTASWEVYENEGDGFASSWEPWSLPGGYADDTFEALGDSDYSDGVTWGLTDLDGDGRSDLVFTANDNVSGMGTTKWQVYTNTGDGFTATPEEWTLPQGFPADTFEALADSDYNDAYRWFLTDLDGDDAPDLVITSNDNAAAVGTTEWQVYENTGSGFTNSPVSWSLPQGFAADTFESLYDVTSSDGVAWGLSDLDGDGRTDLVLTETEAAPGVGTEMWLLYVNEGSGFANSPDDFTLPAGFPDQTFDALSDARYGDDFTWWLTDLGGDGPPDLVFTTNTLVDGVGTTEWQVYQSDGSSFSSTPDSWALPGGYATATFDSLGDDASDGVGWALVSLDGDPVTELVISQNDDIPALGTGKWQVYFGDCR